MKLFRNGMQEEITFSSPACKKDRSNYRLNKVENLKGVAPCTRHWAEKKTPEENSFYPVIPSRGLENFPSFSFSFLFVCLPPSVFPPSSPIAPRRFSRSHPPLVFQLKSKT